MPYTKHSIRRPRGTVLIYVTVGMMAFVGFVSLGVDVGHVRVVKTELQLAADAAARYAAAGLKDSVGAAQSNAVAAAAANIADSTSVVVDPNNDVDFGTWDLTNHTFTVLAGSDRSNANAVRVTCRRTAARGNPVSLDFGAVIGISQCDVTAHAIAVLEPNASAVLYGVNGISFKNNTFIGSYDSSQTTTPNQSSAGNKTQVASNGAVQGNNNNSIQGDVVLGPGGSLSGVNVTGSQVQEPNAVPTPTMPTWTPQSNPGGVSQNYTAPNNAVLPGGTYWFTSFTVNNNLTFSGPTTIYVNGNVTVSGTLAPASGLPADLTIYQYGPSTFGDGSSNGMNITANIVAPGSDFTAKNNLNFYGKATFGTITTKNDANFYYDVNLSGSNGGVAVHTVQ